MVGAVLAYLPVVVVHYAFEDDYWVLGQVHGLGGANVWSAAVGGGRPIQGALLTGIFRLVPNIDALWLVRVLGLVGAVALGLLLYYALHRSGLNRWFAAAIALTVIALPSFQVYVSWAVLFEAPYAAVLAGLAWLRLSSRLGWRSCADLLRGAESVVLLLCALFTYQPAAMFFWVFAAIDLLRPAEHLSRAARKFGDALAVAFIAMLGAFLWVRAVHLYFGTSTGRSSLNHDLVGKLQWFWNEPLPNALNLFELVPSWTLAGGLALMAAVGIFLLHATKRVEALGFLAIAAVLVPLSYLPNLLLSENFASYRSMGALSALFMLYAWLGLWGIARSALVLRDRSGANVVTASLVVLLATLLSFLALAVVVVPLSHLPNEPVTHAASLKALHTWPRLVPFSLLFAALVVLASAGIRFQAAAKIGAASGVAAVAVTGLLLAARNVTTLFAKPESAEVKLLRSTLDKPRALDAERVLYIKSNWNQGAAPLVRYDEFGLPSSFAPWVPGPAVLLLLREKGRATRPRVDVLAWDQVGPRPRAGPETVIVDMRKLQDSRVAWNLWTMDGGGQ